MEKLNKPVVFTVTGIKEALNQPHKHYIAKNEAVKNILSLLKDAEYVKPVKSSKDKQFIYHYFRTFVGGEESFIVVRESTFTGQINFYSIVDKLKED